MKKFLLHGALGKALRLSCENRLKKVDYAALAEPFRLRNEDDNAWRCEFWGKVIRSAILTNYWLRDAELAEKIRAGVRAILKCQTPDGCISSYPENRQCQGWDIWGRKYVLLGLLRYYRYVDADPRVLEAACRLTDHLFRQLQSRGVTLVQTGNHSGLASCSVLTAVMELYSVCGERRFLDYAEQIVRLGCNWMHDVFEAARNGVLPSEMGNGKAYELTSCFEGLADYHLAVPDDRHLDACRRYFEGVRHREIFITGTGGLKDGSGEFWCSGAFHQTQEGRGVGMFGETCITATWLHYCLKMARLEPDSPVPFQEAEKTLYNALLGAMTPDGSNWCHQNPTPLTGGDKRPSTDQILRVYGKPFLGNDCCRAQGPEGLACAPFFILDGADESVLTLNMYEALDAEFSDGTRLAVAGGYPFSNETTVRLVTPGARTLRLRVPDFCRSIRVNGESVAPPANGYLEITRSWTGADAVSLHFDLSPREVAPPDGSPFTAVKCGAVVMAEDSRGSVPDARLAVEWNGRRLVDYATAGNAFSPDNTLRVWFPK